MCSFWFSHVSSENGALTNYTRGKENQQTKNKEQMNEKGAIIDGFSVLQWKNEDHEITTTMSRRCTSTHNHANPTRRSDKGQSKVKLEKLTTNLTPMTKCEEKK